MFRAEVERTNVIPVAAKLLDGARAAGVKVVYSRASFQPGYPELVPNIPLFTNVARYGCLVDGTAGAANIGEVAPHDGDVVLTHHRASRGSLADDLSAPQRIGRSCRDDVPSGTGLCRVGGARA